MASEVFHKLDSFFHFLPKFDVAIDAGGHNEIGFGHNDVRDGIAMHVTLLIAFGVW